MGNPAVYRLMDMVDMNDSIKCGLDKRGLKEGRHYKIEIFEPGLYSKIFGKEIDQERYVLIELLVEATNIGWKIGFEEFCKKHKLPVKRIWMEH